MLEVNIEPLRYGVYYNQRTDQIVLINHQTVAFIEDGDNIYSQYLNVGYFLELIDKQDTVFLGFLNE